MVPAETLRAVREKAELLGGRSLGENGDRVTALALEKALAWCQREDVPEDMEQAAAGVVLALFCSIPRAEEDGGEDAPGPLGSLAPAGAVKSIQRGDTCVTFASGGESGASGGAASALSGGTVSAALAELAPWRRPGRLKGGTA